MENIHLQIKTEIKNQSDRFYRRTIQIIFLFFVIWIGIEFILFVHSLGNADTFLPKRPTGLETFLSISALVRLRYWLLTGIFNTIHPAAVVIFLTILGILFLLKKEFCSWMYPLGFLSETITFYHQRIFNRRVKLTSWIEFPFRRLKYLLLIFFLCFIFVQRGLNVWDNFIYSPFNQIADINMLKFFSSHCFTTIWSITLLFFLSLLIPYFWCHYLYPYGALLGVVSMVSPCKIKREKEAGMKFG